MKLKPILLLTLLFSMLGESIMAQESEIVYLSGRGENDTKTWRFKCSDGRKAGRWGRIEVPSQWEQQGYGDYTYGRWYRNKGEQPSMEEGFYEYSFKVPKDWKGQRVVIWFDGVMTDTEVSVNGQLAGEKHRGGFYRFSYDITDKLKWGKSNKLEVHVWKHSDNRLVNAAERKADWWLFGGIYRPVWLEVMPQTSIEHIAVDAKADGTVATVVELNGQVSGYTLSASVKPLNETTVVGEKGGFRIGRTNTLTIDFACAGIQPWTCENPHLYELTVNLHDLDGNIVHSRSSRIGFRTIEFRPKDGIYLNDTKLIVKGVNRHSFWPETGRTTSKELSIMDAKLIKEMNMNAVRSHYPPDEHFLDVCDSLGLLYIDELAGWQNAYDDEVGRKVLAEMIRRDVNHPCIFLWSNGNEGGWNANLDELFAMYDPQQRHVIHAWADFNGLDTHHYPAYLTGVSRFNNGSNVFMPTEFMHAQYDKGGGAGMADFWNRWMTSPLFAGGFIWVFSDEAIVRTDRGGKLDSDKGNAPDGIVGPRREKEGSFYTIREVWSPIQIKPLRITGSYHGELFVTNSYLFNSLEGCRINYRLYKTPSPLSVDNDENVTASCLAEGSHALPAILPGETRRVEIALPQWGDADILEYEAVDANGQVLCNWTFPILTPAEYLLAEKRSAGIVTEGPDPNMPVTMLPAYAELKNGKIQLLNGSAAVCFDPVNGQIISVTKDEKAIPFNNGPIAVGMKMKYNADKSVLRVERGPDGRELAVYVAHYQGGVDSIVWKLDADGRLAMDAVMLNRSSGGGGFDDAFMDTEVRYLGLTFSYPDSVCSGMKWLGRGPYRVWKNRIPGTNYNIWHKDYNNTITGESFEALIYPEFKGYHANLYWATIESPTSPFTVYCESENIYFRVFTPEEPSGRSTKSPTMGVFPEGDLSFLLDIPAIQSYKPISQQGPQSQPGNVRIKKGDEGIRIKLLFDF